MPSIPLYPPRRYSDRNGTTAVPVKPLPQLLQTPSGLALLEIQGTLHTSTADVSPDCNDLATTETSVGRLVFPLYDSNSENLEDQSWMKRVYLYVGKHQRLTGEVKRLPKAVAIVRKHESSVADKMVLDGKDPSSEDAEPGERLEIVEIVTYKILFASRPEPVGD